MYDEPAWAPYRRVDSPGIFPAAIIVGLGIRWRTANSSPKSA